MKPPPSFCRILFLSLLFWSFGLLCPVGSSAAANLSSPSAGQPDGDARYILIHVDGISSWHLMQEMEEGNLPHLKKLFYPDGWIPGGVTYLPSKTPVVIANMKHSTAVEDGGPVSWAGQNRETGDDFSPFDTFRAMISGMSRLTRTNLIYGIPLLDRLNRVALGNLPDYLDQYRVLEYYWYPIDTYGHFYGEDSYREKIREFDRQIGRLAERIGPDVNLVIYSDHGIAFGEGVESDRLLKERFEPVRSASYPNAYLERGVDRREVSIRIVEETPVDFVFYQSGIDEVTGVHREGFLTFRFDPKTDRYSYQAEGGDPLGYHRAGYRGESLTTEEWLEQTWNSDYPMAPVKVFHLLQNPGAGDLLTFFEHGKYGRTEYSSFGNHGGFTRMEMNVPILVRGPDLTHLYGRTTIEIEHLMQEIAAPEPSPTRDHHYLEMQHELDRESFHLELSFSPLYRWGIGAELTAKEDGLNNPYRVWLQADLFRSYLSRVWVGGGVNGRIDGKAEAELFLKHELHVRRISAKTLLSSTGDHRFTIEARIANAVALRLTNFRRAGLRFYF